MLTVLIFFLIFVGVTLALYQVYALHFNINFDHAKKLSKESKSNVNALTLAFRDSEEGTNLANRKHVITTLLGKELEPHVAHRAFSEQGINVYGVSLIRRYKKMVFEDAGQKSLTSEPMVRHFPFFKTRLPRVNARGLLIILVIFNCCLTQLLGAMSIYTISYSVNVFGFHWLNEPVFVMLAIYAIVLINLVIFKLDMYLHDLYTIRQLWHAGAVASEP